jgi:hypothetical protein
MRQFGFVTAITIVCLGGIALVTYRLTATERISISCPVRQSDAMTQNLVDAAIALSEKISNPQEKADAQRKLAIVTPDSKQCKTLLTQALLTIRTIESPAIRATVLVDVAETYRSLKLANGEILTEAFAIVSLHQEQSIRSSSSNCSKHLPN